MFIGRGGTSNTTLIWNGSFWVTASVTSSAGGSDNQAQYVVMSATASLANERVLSASVGLTLTDAGAGAGAIFRIDDSITATVSGTRFTGGVQVQGAGFGVTASAASPEAIALRATGQGGGILISGSLFVVTASRVLLSSSAVTASGDLNVMGNFVSIGANTSGTGSVRLPTDGSVFARAAGSAVDISVIRLTPSNNLEIGQTSTLGAIDTYSPVSAPVRILPGGAVRQSITSASYSATTADFSVATSTNASTAISLQAANGGGIALSGSSLHLSASDTSGARLAGALIISGSSSDRTATAKHGTLYASGSGGAGVWMSANSTLTVFAPAEPECHRCGIDYVIAARNDRLGWRKEICVNCLMRSLDKIGIDRSEYVITDEGAN